MREKPWSSFQPMPAFQVKLPGGSANKVEILLLPLLRPMENIGHCVPWAMAQGRSGGNRSRSKLRR
jgi:hypothetical protein